MNMQGLKNIGPAPDSGPMRCVGPERPVHLYLIMVYRREKVTNLSKAQSKMMKWLVDEAVFSEKCSQTSSFTQRHRLFHESVTIFQCPLVTTIDATIDRTTTGGGTIDAETTGAATKDGTNLATTTRPQKSNAGSQNYGLANEK
ncbi:MAG: hypothetical protein HON07_02040 [Planctomycetaceae bacterium]|mgnify:CR=1 FL=1|nr:hypothetical protein [Planctomycetaceae bacterium]